jgi:hypothetical protein
VILASSTLPSLTNLSGTYRFPKYLRFVPIASYMTTSDLDVNGISLTKVATETDDTSGYASREDSADIA